ncbi:hypothetical protein C7Y66_01430 [Chroococcidiopsis sp. CCALA 051]|nr:hypothetical protein C7Y66_01430 [Chroococcidiopsis sp. CCALA 051]
MELGISTTLTTVMVAGMRHTTDMAILMTLPFLPTMMAMLKPNSVFRVTMELGILTTLHFNRLCR